MQQFEANGNVWGTLHANSNMAFLHVIDATTYEWTDDENTARDSQKILQKLQGH